jgi:hypothetical protein
MAYEYDVFVSYRRHAEWPSWVENIFWPLFYHWLGEEVPNVKIFIDHDIETGDAWPQKLGQALGRSRVLVPLLSRQYFSSPWCQLEFGHMLAREERCGFRTAQNPRGLIVPAYIHDGDSFPPRAREIQAAHLQPYTNVRLSKESPTEERLSEEIRRWVPHIAAAVRTAPQCDELWMNIAVQEFVQQFATVEPVQMMPPKLG